MCINLESAMLTDKKANPRRLHSICTGNVQNRQIYRERKQTALERGAEGNVKRFRGMAVQLWENRKNQKSFHVQWVYLMCI